MAGLAGVLRRVGILAVVALVAVLPSAVSALGMGAVLGEEDLAERFGDDPDLVAAILEVEPLPGLGVLGFTEYEQRLIRFVGMEVIELQEYAFGDDPEGEPVLQVPGTRPVEIGAVQVAFPRVPAVSEGITDTHVFLTHGQGIVTDVIYALMWVRYDEPYDHVSGETLANRGFVTALPDVRLWESAFAGDTWWGGYQMPALLSDEVGDGLQWRFNMTRYEPSDPRTFLIVQFDGFALLSGDLLVMGIATEDLLGAPPPVASAMATLAHGPGSVRIGHTVQASPVGASLAGAPALVPGDLRIGYASHERFLGSEFFSPGHVTTWPRVPQRGYDDFILGAAAEILEGFAIGADYTWTRGRDAFFDVAEPEPEPTVTTAAEEPAVAPEDPADTGGGVPPIVWVGFVGLAAAALLGWWLRTQRQQTGGSDDPYRDGPTRERGGTPVTAGDEPVTVGREENGDDEPGACGWGLYLVDELGEWPIREPAPNEHLCCKYVVGVVSDVAIHEHVARGRQDAGHERLQIPDLAFGWSGVDFGGSVSARSGPAGRLDWMHGLGDPVDATAESEDAGDGPEPPEVAAHLDHLEHTEVEIILQPGCPDYENRYRARAASRLGVLATHECTNDAGDPCPIELDAFGFAGGWIRGPDGLVCQVGDWTGSDPAEAGKAERSEERRRAGLSPHDAADAHDHAQRDRAAYQVARADSADDVFSQDDLRVRITSDVAIDAGQMVPVAAYPTTERVTAHIEGNLKHELHVAVSLTPVGCEDTGCGGHGRCNCRAEWEMQVGGATGSWIRTDAGQRRIHRIPAEADGSDPFLGRKAWAPEA